MRTLSVGATNRSAERGVTLIELLIVATLIALVIGISFPSAAGGVDSLRLRSAADRIVSFLNTAFDRADRRQQVIQIRISAQENAISARSADLSFDRVLQIPEPIHIAATDVSSFLLYPGGTPPRIAIDLASKDGRKRDVIVDPINGIESK